MEHASVPAATGKLRLGELLLKRGLITSEDLRRALVLQRSQGRFVGEVLLSMGAISAKDLREILSEMIDVPAVDLDVTYGDPTALDQISKSKALELKVIPLFTVENQLTVAMADPNNLAKLDELARVVSP